MAVKSFNSTKKPINGIKITDLRCINEKDGMEPQKIDSKISIPQKTLLLIYSALKFAQSALYYDANHTALPNLGGATYGLSVKLKVTLPPVYIHVKIFVVNAYQYCH